MKMTSSLDLKFFWAIAILLLCIVLAFGDAMFIGLWYYIVVPSVAALLFWRFRPPPLYRLGISLGLITTFVTYWSINYFSARPEGLLGLGHLFSLPGAALGIIISAYISNKLSGLTLLGALFTGLGGILIGFFINQLAVCNTVMWCGSLSL